MKIQKIISRAKHPLVIFVDGVQLHVLFYGNGIDLPEGALSVWISYRDKKEARLDIEMNDAGVMIVR